jgi:hypothetical protein
MEMIDGMVNWGVFGKREVSLCPFLEGLIVGF